MEIRRIGCGYAIYPGRHALDNPIIEVDELRSDINTNYNVKPIERTYQPRRAKNVAGEKGRRIDIIA